MDLLITIPSAIAVVIRTQLPARFGNGQLLNHNGINHEPKFPKKLNTFRIADAAEWLGYHSVISWLQFWRFLGFATLGVYTNDADLGFLLFISPDNMGLDAPLNDTGLSPISVLDFAFTTWLASGVKQMSTKHVWQPALRDLYTKLTSSERPEALTFLLDAVRMFRVGLENEAERPVLIKHGRNANKILSTGRVTVTASPPPPPPSLPKKWKSRQLCRLSSILVPRFFSL